MNTTIRPSHPEHVGFPAGLPAREYKIKCVFSGQGYGHAMNQPSPYIAGMWMHKHWTEVMSRVKNMTRHAHKLARHEGIHKVMVQTVMIKGGAYKRSWIFQDEWDCQEIITMWIVPVPDTEDIHTPARTRYTQ